jgi:streptomycin 6-kinase
MEGVASRVPEPVRLRAVSEGRAGEAWLAGLPAVVAELAAEWGLSLGPALPGGTEAYVAAAMAPDGREAVLKVSPPWRDPAAKELDALLLARGRGYADVYRHDRARGAVLLERLGPRLADLGWSPDAQAEAVCETLERAWTAPGAASGFATGEEKAESLGRFIEEAWLELGRPCPGRTVAAALRCAEDRRRAFDPESAVLCHGDCHPWNTLRAAGRGGPDRFKFVDPDGLHAERAYDLGVLMREWTPELLAGDPLALGRRRCRRLSELTGVEPGPIWRWGLVERVSTGLLCLKIGLEEGGDMLAVAEAWADAPP